VATVEAHGRLVDQQRSDRRTPAQRSLQARVAAYRMHSLHDPRDTTREARAAFLAKFEQEVDPDKRLTEPERRRRAEAAKKAYFNALALKSARARQVRAARS
jgi:hypothetical protein